MTSIVEFEEVAQYFGDSVWIKIAYFSVILVEVLKQSLSK